MKVKDLIANLKRRNQESEVYIETEDDLLDIWEITFGKLQENNKEFTVIIPLREEE